MKGGKNGRDILLPKLSVSVGGGCVPKSVMHVMNLATWKAAVRTEP